MTKEEEAKKWESCKKLHPPPVLSPPPVSAPSPTPPPPVQPSEWHVRPRPPPYPPRAPPYHGGFIPFGPRPQGNLGAMVLEQWAGSWSSSVQEGNRITLRGNQRAYLSYRPGVTIDMSATSAQEAVVREWAHVRYDNLRLLGKTLRLTVDISDVGCGCNAAVYLVNMPQADFAGSRYCDINTPDPERCLEIDLFEGNVKAISAALHTQAGEASDGKCNQWGCETKWGPGDKNCRFGLGSPNIDSNRPFELSTQFDLQGHMSIDVAQAGVTHRLWDVASSGNDPSKRVPEEASAKVKEALNDGMVLVTSLWGGSGVDGMKWLDGGCSAAYPACDLTSATAVFADVHIDGDPAPPWPPPSPLPPPPPVWPNSSPPISKPVGHPSLNELDASSASVGVGAMSTLLAGNSSHGTRDVFPSSFLLSFNFFLILIILTSVILRRGVYICCLRARRRASLLQTQDNTSSDVIMNASEQGQHGTEMSTTNLPEAQREHQLD